MKQTNFLQEYDKKKQLYVNPDQRLNRLIAANVYDP